MKVMVCPRFGGPGVLEMAERPVATVGPGHVRIAICAAGVNYPDLLSVAGRYPIPSEPPFVPGIEGAGIVVECGEGVERLHPGDRVAWQDNVAKGSFAESAVKPEAILALVPDGVLAEVAAALPTAYGTARFALSRLAKLRAGETLLVHGASGGTGMAAVQVGRRMGARVIATGGSPSKADAIRRAGADAFIPLGVGSFREDLRTLTDGRGVDVVFDPVCGSDFEDTVRALTPYGRHLVIGFVAGGFPQVATNILLVKAASVIGANYGYFLANEPDEARRHVEEMLGWVADGSLAPLVEARYSLCDAGKALLDLRNRHATGKMALHIADTGWYI